MTHYASLALANPKLVASMAGSPESADDLYSISSNESVASDNTSGSSLTGRASFFTLPATTFGRNGTDINSGNQLVSESTSSKEKANRSASWVSSIPGSELGNHIVSGGCSKLQKENAVSRDRTKDLNADGMRELHQTSKGTVLGEAAEFLSQVGSLGFYKKSSSKVKDVEKGSSPELKPAPVQTNEQSVVVGRREDSPQGETDSESSNDKDSIEGEGVVNITGGEATPSKVDRAGGEIEMLPFARTNFAKVEEELTTYQKFCKSAAKLAAQAVYIPSSYLYALSRVVGLNRAVMYLGHTFGLMQGFQKVNTFFATKAGYEPTVIYIPNYFALTRAQIMQSENSPTAKELDELKDKIQKHYGYDKLPEFINGMSFTGLTRFFNFFKDLDSGEWEFQAINVKDRCAHIQNIVRKFDGAWTREFETVLKTELNEVIAFEAFELYAAVKQDIKTIEENSKDNGIDEDQIEGFKLRAMEKALGDHKDIMYQQLREAAAHRDLIGGENRIVDYLFTGIASHYDEMLEQDCGSLRNEQKTNRSGSSKHGSYMVDLNQWDVAAVQRREGSRGVSFSEKVPNQAQAQKVRESFSPTNSYHSTPGKYHTIVFDENGDAISDAGSVSEDESVSSTSESAAKVALETRSVSFIGSLVTDIVDDVVDASAQAAAKVEQAKKSMELKNKVAEATKQASELTQKLSRFLHVIKKAKESFSNGNDVSVEVSKLETSIKKLLEEARTLTKTIKELDKERVLETAKRSLDKDHDAIAAHKERRDLTELNRDMSALTSDCEAALKGLITDSKEFLAEKARKEKAMADKKKAEEALFDRANQVVQRGVAGLGFRLSGTDEESKNSHTLVENARQIIVRALKVVDEQIIKLDETIGREKKTLDDLDLSIKDSGLKGERLSLLQKKIEEGREIVKGYEKAKRDLMIKANELNSDLEKTTPAVTQPDEEDFASV